LQSATTLHSPCPVPPYRAAGSLHSSHPGKYSATI
jgi:hypothetical protein